MKELYESATLWGVSFSRSVEWLFTLSLISCFLGINSYSFILMISSVIGLLVNLIYCDFVTRYLNACCESLPSKTIKFWKISLQVLQGLLYFCILQCAVLIIFGSKL